MRRCLGLMLAWVRIGFQVDPEREALLTGISREAGDAAWDSGASST
jgi:hypothetical protein